VSFVSGGEREKGVSFDSNSLEGKETIAFECLEKGRKEPESLHLHSPGKENSSFTFMREKGGGEGELSSIPSSYPFSKKKNQTPNKGERGGEDPYSLLELTHS